MRLASRLGLTAALALLVAFPVAAQTTGTIEGTVVDTTRTPLAGVALEALSPSLQGNRIVVTDAAGRFRLVLLPPGTYRVTAELSQYGQQEKSVVVGLDRVVPLEFVLAPKVVAEQVTVTAEAVGVETASSSSGANLGQTVFQALPTGRNYASVAQLAGGTSTDESDTKNGSVTVYGSTGLENAFLVDGVNTTGVEFGSQGKTLNFEFVQEVEVKTGGYEAEYGHSTGGIINVITKSGGNDFHGDAFAYIDRDSLQADNSHTGEVVAAGIQTGYKRSDFGADIGGYFLKDRIWFFAAYDRVDNSVDKQVTTGPASGTGANTKTTRDLYSGKVTGRLSASHSVILTVVGDPATDKGAINDPIGPASTYLGENEQGGADYSLRYEGIFGTRFLVVAQGARHREKTTIVPDGSGNGIRYEDNRGDAVVASGGFGRIDNKEFTRQDYQVAGSFFVGQHSIKAGFEYEKMDADVSRFFTGGQSVSILSPNEGDTRPIYQHYYWTKETASLPNDAPSVTFTAEPNHKQYSLFLQDRWTVRPNLTINAGLRYDNQEIVSKFGTTAFRVTHFSPRVGFAWDFLSDGKSKLFGSYGQFVQSIPMDMNIRSFSAERNPTVFNFSPTSIVPDADAGDSVILGGYIEPVDPELKAQYLDEISIGIEREVAAGIVAGVKGVYRRYGRVIEDGFVASSGDYFIMNPGEGELGSAYPSARRHFRGLEITAEKRFGGAFQVYASYLLSRLEGNYDGAFNAIKGQKDPNINSDFDYPEFLINNDGPLSLDRTHQFKAQVAYTFPFKLVASLSGYVRSGAPQTRLGWFDTYGRPELFLSTRGAEGRTPTIYEADLHLGYPLVIGPATINILVDVFNLLDKQEAIAVDNRYSFEEADNSKPTPTNSRYLKGRLFQDPRTVRLGLRVSF